jgi:hypothetical protein
MHTLSALDPSRELADGERQLLELLLSRDFPGCKVLLEQLRCLKVSGECTCGCPSIVFSIESTQAGPAPVKRRIPVEASCQNSNGSETHVLLHVVGGWLEELEIYRDDAEAVTAIPATVELTLFCLDWD